MTVGTELCEADVVRSENEIEHSTGNNQFIHRVSSSSLKPSPRVRPDGSRVSPKPSPRFRVTFGEAEVVTCTSEVWTDGSVIYEESEEFQNPADDDMVQLQAVLTVLPYHALTWGVAFDKCRANCGLGSTSETTPGSQQVPLCIPLIEEALSKARKLYPSMEKHLRDIEVVHATDDMSCFADHTNERLFTAVRGTDILTLRDLGNDALIAFGYEPYRSGLVEAEYQIVRTKYPTYESYGCGHSLGGSVMNTLAYHLEKHPELSFTRVDVFNAGGSPLMRRYTALHRTQFNSHRVANDLISMYFQPAGETVEHPANSEFNSHAMGHFLPPRRQTIYEALTSWTYRFRCCSPRPPPGYE